MTEYQKFRVAGERGLRGTVFTTSRFLDESEYKLMRLDDGREFLIPSDALASMPDGSYRLQLPVSELDRYGKIETQSRSTEPLSTGPSRPVNEPAITEQRPPDGETNRQGSRVL